MPSSHLILCHPLLFLPPIPPCIRVFSSESTLGMRWLKYWSFTVLCNGLCGKRTFKKKKVEISICVIGSLCCTPETNTTLQSNYTPINIKKKKKRNCQTCFPDWLNPFRFYPQCLSDTFSLPYCQHFVLLQVFKILAIVTFVIISFCGFVFPELLMMLNFSCAYLPSLCAL